MKTSNKFIRENPEQHPTLGASDDGEYKKKKKVELKKPVMMSASQPYHSSRKSFVAGVVIFIAFLLSLVWAWLFVAYYTPSFRIDGLSKEDFITAKNYFTNLPLSELHELGISFLIPLILLWVLASNFYRSVQVRFYIRMLEKRLNLLPSPEAKLNDIAVFLQEQRYLLEQLSDKVDKSAEFSKEALATEIHHLSGKLDDRNQVISTAGKTLLEQVPARIEGFLKEQTQSLDHMTGQALENIRESQKSFTEYQNRLKQQVEDVENTLKTPGQQTEIIKESFELQLQAIRTMATEMTEETNALILEKFKTTRDYFESCSTEIGTISEQISKRFQDVGALIRKEASLLSEASARISSDMRISAARLSDTPEKNKTSEPFLSTAQSIMKTLHEASLEIDQLLQKDIPDKIWKSWKRGDQAVFTKHVLAFFGTDSTETIKKTYQKDSAFVAHVDHYLKQFDQLLNDAVSQENGDLLSATFMSADIGKLYLVLSQAVRD